MQQEGRGEEGEGSGREGPQGEAGPLRAGVWPVEGHRQGAGLCESFGSPCRAMVLRLFLRKERTEGCTEGCTEGIPGGRQEPVMRVPEERACVGVLLQGPDGQDVWAAVRPGTGGRLCSAKR